MNSPKPSNYRMVRATIVLNKNDERHKIMKRKEMKTWIHPRDGRKFEKHLRKTLEDKFLTNDINTTNKNKSNNGGSREMLLNKPERRNNEFGNTTEHGTEKI